MRRQIRQLYRDLYRYVYGHSSELPTQLDASNPANSTSMQVFHGLSDVYLTHENMPTLGIVFALSVLKTVMNFMSAYLAGTLSESVLKDEPATIY